MDPSLSEYGTNMFNTHTQASSLSFQAHLEGGQVPFGHLSLSVPGQPRLIFDEYVLMEDQTWTARCGPAPHPAF